MKELLKLEHGCIYHLKSVHLELLIIYKDPDITMKCRKNYHLSFDIIAQSRPSTGNIEDLTMYEYFNDIKKFIKNLKNIFEKIEISALPLFLHLYKNPKFMELLKAGPNE